ncbi:hypothetical protein PVAND_004283 [Polypedilum vanderplanki]|uniref:Peptidase S1 domain-containing protein n=1 Tax=Polypedilum vanderplanki TaxID=319348 RepID=A0A9J6BWI3_POLVA|nr:hypothetical protein PVAND_004283 [Polypedilum vanderplanki]
MELTTPSISSRREVFAFLVQLFYVVAGATSREIMMKKLLILATIVLLARADFRAPYQASIQLKSSNGKQLCNGIIIHEEYILTTANCLYLQVTIAGGDFSILAPSGDLTIVVGGSNTTTVERNVVSIIPHHKFNKTTYDNDLAVLKLDRALPLANNTEIQWLDIATGSSGGLNDSCFLTAFNSSQANSTGFYSIWKKPAKEICNDQYVSNLIRKTDLCLEYFLSTNADCNSTFINLIHSNERGTAYVCDNKLVAILADINPSRNVEKCFEKRQTTAYYVDVRNQTEWLSVDLGISLKQSSVPSWTLKPENTETSSTSSSSSITTTTGSSKHPSSASKVSNSFILVLLLVKLVVF